MQYTRSRTVVHTYSRTYVHIITTQAYKQLQWQVKWFFNLLYPPTTLPSKHTLKQPIATVRLSVRVYA